MAMVWLGLILFVVVLVIVVAPGAERLIDRERENTLLDSLRAVRRVTNDTSWTGVASRT